MATITAVGTASVSVPPDEASLALEAATAAATAARARAEALAAGVGVRLGALVEVVEAGASPPQPRGGMRVLAMAEAVPVEAGEQSVTAAVTVTYQVEQP